MLKNSTRRLLTKAQTKYFVPLIRGLFIFVLLTVSCQTDRTQQQSPDFQLVAEVDLSARPHEGEVVGEFTVGETAVTHIFYTSPNIDTTIFDLSLSGPDGESFVILHSENFRTDAEGGGTWISEPDAASRCESVRFSGKSATGLNWPRQASTWRRLSNR